MMDLTPINSLPQLQAIDDLPLLELVTVTTDTTETNESLDFYAIMKELILDNLVPLKSKHEVKAPSNPVDEEADPGLKDEVDIKASSAADTMAETTMLDDEPVLKEPEAIDPDQNTALLWINAQSYEPPVAAQTEHETVLEEEHETPAPIQARAFEKETQPLLNGDLIQANEEVEVIELNPDHPSTESFQKLEQKKPLLNNTAEPRSETRAITKTLTSEILADMLKNRFISSNEYQSEGFEIEDELVSNPIDTSSDTVMMSSMNQLQSTSRASATQTPALAIAQSIESPEWGTEFNQQIAWLGQQKIDRAVIKLNPQEFGPLEVNIHFNQDQASVNFTTHTNQVRDLIEQSIPVLREMLADQGVNLSQVNIESNANQNQHRQQSLPQQNNASDFSLDQLMEEVPEQSTRVFKTSQGLVDYFA